MDIITAYNDTSTIKYENINTKLLREIAFNNKKREGIFKNYNEYEIRMLTKRQLVYILKIEQKYKQLRRDYEPNK